MIESVKQMTDSYNEARLEGEPIMTVEEMGAFVGYADTLCSWCGKYLSTNPSTTGMTSHGICQTCSDNVMLEMALEEFKVKPKTNKHIERVLQLRQTVCITPSEFYDRKFKSFNLIQQAYELMQVGRKRQLKGVSNV